MRGRDPCVHVLLLDAQTWMAGTSPRMTSRSDLPYHAGATAARATGFSTIGRLISAERTPNSAESHQTES